MERSKQENRWKSIRFQNRERKPIPGFKEERKNYLGSNLYSIKSEYLMVHFSDMRRWLSKDICLLRRRWVS